jgi:hypothetical protein
VVLLGSIVRGCCFEPAPVDLFGAVEDRADGCVRDKAAKCADAPVRSGPRGSVSAGVRRASRMLRLEPSTVQAHLLHLAFIGVLQVGLDEPLSMEA